MSAELKKLWRTTTTVCTINTKLWHRKAAINHCEHYYSQHAGKKKYTLFTWSPILAPISAGVSAILVQNKNLWLICLGWYKVSHLFTFFLIQRFMKSKFVPLIAVLADSSPVKYHC